MQIKFPLLEKRPRKRNRSIKAPAYTPPAPPPPPPALAHVVGVDTEGFKEAIWTFDKVVVSIADATGLMCPASGAVTGASVTGANTVAVQYEEVVSGGDTWECTAAAVVMTFADGATLQDGTGFIAGS